MSLLESVGMFLVPSLVSQLSMGDPVAHSVFVGGTCRGTESAVATAGLPAPPPATLNINILNSRFGQISLSHVAWLGDPSGPLGRPFEAPSFPPSFFTRILSLSALGVVMHTKCHWDCLAVSLCLPALSEKPIWSLGHVSSLPPSIQWMAVYAKNVSIGSGNKVLSVFRSN